MDIDEIIAIYRQTGTLPESSDILTKDLLNKICSLQDGIMKPSPLVIEDSTRRFVEYNTKMEGSPITNHRVKVKNNLANLSVDDVLKNGLFLKLGGRGGKFLVTNKDTGDKFQVSVVTPIYGAVLGYDAKSILVFLRQGELIGTVDASNERSWKVLFMPEGRSDGDGVPQNASIFKFEAAKGDGFILTHRRFSDERPLRCDDSPKGKMVMTSGNHRPGLFANIPEKE